MRAAAAIVIVLTSLCLGQSASAALPSGPSHCGGKDLRATLVSFSRALNQGDYEQLDQVFAEKPDFQWYATDGRIGAAAKRRDTLIPYFRARHDRGERLGLIRFRFNGNSRHYGNFEMTMRRSDPSVREGAWLPVRGKGAAVCAAGSTRLIVMSYGRVSGR
jgi:hypothetical protein